jgi:hypothetical protein
MEHTPGPWRASARNIYSSELNVVIAQCWDIALFTDDPLPVKANACLIAAAPALLEACEAGQESLICFEHEYFYCVGCWEIAGGPYEINHLSPCSYTLMGDAIAAARPATEPVEEGR